MGSPFFSRAVCLYKNLVAAQARLYTKEAQNIYTYEVVVVEALRQGIVLRVGFPLTNKIELFDDRLGRITGVMARAVHLVHGELITYHVEPWKHRYRISDIQAQKLPASWVYTDILFLHHVLELAYFFLPENNTLEQVFKLYLFLYADEEGTGLMKELFLGKFFALLGVYPDPTVVYDQELFNLFSDPQKWYGENKQTEMYDEQLLRKKLQQWLLGCIHTHPHANTFTTLHFLYAHID